MRCLCFAQVTLARHDPDALRLMKVKVREDLEEHDLMVNLRQNVDGSVLAEMAKLREALEDKLSRINSFLSAVSCQRRPRAKQSTPTHTLQWL